jgi:hypothetical protein
MVNRSAVLVRAREPFLEWAKKHGEGMFYPTEGERSVYLLPNFKDNVESEDLLRQYCDLIFEAELEGWITDPTTWPKERSYERFREWFEVEHHSVVEDLVAGKPLVDDEL